MAKCRSSLVVGFRLLAGMVSVGCLVSCRALHEPVVSVPPVRIYVSPAGSDEATGTADAPFRTVYRAQQAARQVAESAPGEVIVELAPGVYRLDRTLQLTDADSGRNGNTVIYRSSGGLGKARLLGSVPLKGWQPYRDGIWKISVPEKTVFHTLYENGLRAHKARFPNREYLPDFPTARGRYLVSQDGTPVLRDKDPKPKTREPSWLTYAPEDAPPVTTVGPKMKMLLFGGGKCDWMRVVSQVLAIDPSERRIEISRHWNGVGTGARFFLEDDLGFLDAPGEFYLDEQENTLYYKPMGSGHPDSLGIAMPRLLRLIEINGSSRDACASNLRLEGLALEETDGEPKGWWSTRYGLSDGALVWMGNTTNVEIRECHLKNSGRNGVMMAGHNVGNRIVGCWIEHMGLNGVTLSNCWHDRKKVPPILDRCEDNLVYNCRIHNIGEIHTYAGCINVFNAVNNEIGYCDLYDSVRYAVTVRGNTGEQYGPPVTREYQPPCTGNRMHHLRVFRCGQDGGDMGALHCANLNNPGGGFVNTFEQITVADCAAIPSMKDIAPDGIFLDWPKMSMDQIFSNIHIIRSQGTQIRSNGRDNADSAQTTNVSWEPEFDPGKMDYENIGVTASFPAEYGGRRVMSAPLPKPRHLTARAMAYDVVELSWLPPDCSFHDTPWYTLYRDGEKIALVSELSYTDRGLSERTRYRYQVAAQDGDFCRPGARTPVCGVRTLLDKALPTVENVWSTQNGNRIRVLFSKPVDSRSALKSENYSFEPACRVTGTRLIAPVCAELDVDGLGTDCRLTITGVTDNTISRNELIGADRLPVAMKGNGACYAMNLTFDGCLLDALGSGGDAKLYGDAVVEQGAGPFGGPALVLDGKTGYAEASPDFNLGPGDFTIMLWMMKVGNGSTALSKGNGFESLTQWSFGWPKAGVANSVSLRLNNVFYSTGAQSVPKNEWVHVVFARRGSQGFTYVNGEPSGGPHDLSTVGDLTNDEPLRIGRRTHEPNPDFFKGRITGVKVLDRALSDEEIRMAARGTN